MKYFIGVDIGGTNLKAGVVNDRGEIISEASTPTGAERPQDVVLQDIIHAVNMAIDSAGGVSRSEIRAVGIGSPGITDSNTGKVLYNCNLGWKDFDIAGKMSQALNMPARLENDADVAALGEVVAGSAKGASSAIIITLGTGVGVGYILDGKIIPGSEFGHMVIKYGGRECNCGRKGCWEAYASATGLINLQKDAIASHPESILAGIAREEGVVSGHTVFVARDKGDSVAESVIDEYIGYLACGLVNLINGLHPEIISIGGGIGKQGERLLVPLRERIRPEVYGEKDTGINNTKIVSCTLGYKAGLIGAAMSVRDM